VWRSYTRPYSGREPNRAVKRQIDAGRVRAVHTNDPAMPRIAPAAARSKAIRAELPHESGRK